MLRLRLFFGLITLILILWGVGGTALMLTSDPAAPSELPAAKDPTILAAAHALRTRTQVLNSHYFAAGAPAAAGNRMDRGLYDEIKTGLEQEFSNIKAGHNGDEHWLETVASLRLSLDTYENHYQKLLQDAAPGQSERTRLFQAISVESHRLAGIANTLAATAGETPLVVASGANAEHRNNSLFVVTFVLIGTVIAAMMYSELIKHLVDPVTALRQSLEEIRKGNLELILPSPNRGSEFAGMVNAFNDMAAELNFRRRESDLSLLRANMVNQAILESIPSPVFLVGDDNSIIRINRAAENLTECLGVSGGLPLKIQHILDECRRTLTNFLPQEPQDAVLFRIEEEEFHYLPRIFRFDAGGPAQSGWAILLHNVSRIRWLDDMKTNLLATISHEIKNPLTGIRMALLLMLEERSGALSGTQRRLMSSASSDCERLLTTLHNLLELSNAENGSTQLERVPIAIESCVTRTIQLFSGTADTRRIALRMDLPDAALPDVFADPVRIDEVLNNLVSNAIKHSPDGGEVVLRLSRPYQRHVRVSVIDQGPGVPEASQSRIFERFYRAPGQETQGVGLGLFICREIMRAHDGQIGLCERSDDVTEFFIDVPLA